MRKPYLTDGRNSQSQDTGFDASLARTLTAAFFDRDPRRVARGILGKVLLRQERGKVLAARIVEVEAYLGENDPAAHAAVGLTARNNVLFGPPGRAYVYFIYGNHFCLNVSCMKEGKAGCVLIRAAEPLAGTEQMFRARGLAPGSRHLRNLTTGPGRLAQAFGITRPRDNGKDLTSPASDLQVVDDGFARKRVLLTPRIGITKAAEERLRYVMAGSEFVSRADRAGQKALQSD